MKTTLNQDEIREELHAFVSRFSSQKEAAQNIGVSGAFLSDVLAGRRDISELIAQKLGFTRSYCYRPISVRKNEHTNMAGD